MTDSASAVYLRLLKKYGGVNPNGTHDATGLLFRNAMNDNDIDKLLSYEKLLAGGVPAYRLHFATTVITYLQRNGYKDIASFLTGEHLHTLNTVEDEIPKYSSWHEFKPFAPRHDALRNLVVDNFEHRDDIVHLVQSNQTVDPELIRPLLKERLRHHSSIRSGIL
jgi:hypothetical protein